MGCMAEKTKLTRQQTTQKEKVDEKRCEQNEKKEGATLNPEETVEELKQGGIAKQQKQPDHSQKQNLKNSVIILTPPTTVTVTVSSASQRPRKQGWVEAELHPYQHKTRPKQQQLLRLSPRPAWTIADKYVGQDFRKTEKVLNLNHEKIKLEQLWLRKQRSSK